MADPRVECVTLEGHALRLELGARGRDVGDVEGGVGVLLGGEGDAELLRLPDTKARLSSPELVLRVVVGPETQGFHVERPGTLAVPGGNPNEIESGDHPFLLVDGCTISATVRLSSSPTAAAPRTPAPR